MGFLDNSGDIILDAVLTDTGRFRLAKGDGSFKIAKYAFADDEIDYAKYDKNHSSGSAYYDLDVLKTPVLEAFTNNTSMMKHKLLSIPRTNLLYLPVIRLHEATTNGGTDNSLDLNTTATEAKGMYLVAVDEDTEDALGANYGDGAKGLIHGATWSIPKKVRLDQGLDTTQINKYFPLDPDLKETKYIVEMDNRLGYIASPTAGNPRQYHFLDDDGIAAYSFTLGTDNALVSLLQDTVGGKGQTPISGPRGTMFVFSVRSSLELETSTYLFTKLGKTGQTFGTASGTYSYIDTNIRITGGTTGYSIDIPFRFIKKD
tara:strand:+ start:223 stop:1170 length:948 start_codon:yes stop_codon:yes gene_type:complete